MRRVFVGPRPPGAGRLARWISRRNDSTRTMTSHGCGLAEAEVHELQGGNIVGWGVSEYVA